MTFKSGDIDQSVFYVICILKCKIRHATSRHDITALFIRPHTHGKRVFLILAAKCTHHSSSCRGGDLLCMALHTSVHLHTPAHNSALLCMAPQGLAWFCMVPPGCSGWHSCVTRERNICENKNLGLKWISSCSEGSYGWCEGK